MFEQKDIAEYYDTTQVHYKKWWNLDKYLSLHYGIWTEKTKTFSEALVNTNNLLLRLSNITESDKVLDAGCGVGGAAFYIHENKKAEVVGISLSSKQILMANEITRKKKLEGQTKFYIMDFTNTGLPDESFDVVWACESVCHSADKTKFIEECYRLLKKGGRLIMCDFFLANEMQKDRNMWIDKWKKTWAIEDFVSMNSFENNLKQTGFQNIKSWDYTKNIERSAKKMYYASILGAIPSEIYNLFHPKVSRFAKTHYKCGFYQYKALSKKLWNYNVILAVK